VTQPHNYEAIQELVDGTLGPIRRAELEQHLAECEPCRRLLADLKKIRDAAGTLDRLTPPDRTWLQIAGRLRQEGRIQPAVTPAPAHRRYAMLAIAATLLVAVGASLVLLIPRLRSGGQAPQAPSAQQTERGNAGADDAVKSVEAEFRLAEQHYQNAIAKLEAAARSDQSSIDPQTAAMLQKNLQIIDQAIAESRSALKSEPQSVPARDSLFEALRRKVGLLQDTIALMNEMRKGNAAGAAQIVEGANKS
jgi:Putative zinc-finger